MQMSGDNWVEATNLNSPEVGQLAYGLAVSTQSFMLI